MKRLVAVTLGAFSLASVVLFAGACGAGRLPAPPFVAHPTEALTEVPFPPPPARVEFVPKRPGGEAVWIDGEWTWQGRRWGWKPGRWVVAPPNAAFAPWTSVRDPRGTLFVAAGTWRNGRGDEVPEPTALAIGRPSIAAIVNAEGETVPAGPVRPVDGGGGEGPDAGESDAGESDAAGREDARDRADADVDAADQGPTPLGRSGAGAKVGGS